MRIQAQVRSIEYYYIDIEVPDDADEDARHEAVIAAYEARSMDPDDHDFEVGDIDIVKEDEQ